MGKPRAGRPRCILRTIQHEVRQLHCRGSPVTIVPGPFQPCLPATSGRSRKGPALQTSRRRYFLRRPPPRRRRSTALLFCGTAVLSLRPFRALVPGEGACSCGARSSALGGPFSCLSGPLASSPTAPPYRLDQPPSSLVQAHIRAHTHTQSPSHTLKTAQRYLSLTCKSLTCQTPSIAPQPQKCLRPAPLRESVRTSGQPCSPDTIPDTA